VEEKQQTQLEQQIRQYGFCAAIEVTNGINISKCVKPGGRFGKLEDKARQARRGRRYLSEVNRNADVDAGILAFRTQNIERAHAADYKIDFIYRIRGYEQERAEKALIRVVGMEMPKLDGQLAAALLLHVRLGEDLETLIYPENWKSFKEAFPALARNCWSPEQYRRDLQHVKGWVLEQYARLLCADAMPGVLVAGPWRYSPYHDIDITLAGSRETIYAGLNNQRYFELTSTAVTPLPSPALPR
jgi:hypothetical protein